MPKIDKATQLTALLRAGLQELGQGVRSTAKTTETIRGGAAESLTTPTELPSAQAQLHALIAQRVRNLSKDDPQRKRKAFKIFLESVLMHDFGVGLAGDSAFQMLIEQVLRDMESDEELSMALQELADLLFAQVDM